MANKKGNNKFMRMSYINDSSCHVDCKATILVSACGPQSEAFSAGGACGVTACTMDMDQSEDEDGSKDTKKWIQGMPKRWGRGCVNF